VSCFLMDRPLPPNRQISFVMDRLHRAPERSQLLRPIIPTSRRSEQQADGCSIRRMGSSWDGSSRRMGDPNCAREITTRLCRSRQPADGAAGLSGAPLVGECGARRLATTSPCTEQFCCCFVEPSPRRVLR
jgi:hypothetical protein